MHRLSPVSFCLVLWLAVPSGAAAEPPGEWAFEQDTVDSGEPSEEDTDEIAEQWARVFAPPDPWQAELGLGAGWTWWDTAYGRVESEGDWRLQGRWALESPWALSAGLDYTRQAPKSGPLTLADTHIGLLAGGGPQWWLGRWKLGLDARAGALYRRLRISDESGTDLRRSRVEPGAELLAHAGLSIGGRVALTLDGGVRWRKGRLDRTFLINLAWLFEK